MSAIPSPNESEPLCEGDTKVIYDVLPHPLSEGIFERVRDEVQWQRMSHQGGEVPRLVAVQGDVPDDTDTDTGIPIYRHPADESPPLRPFTPAVREIKQVVEARLGHPVNHALIQLYRDGADYISEHSDKTLDIARGSFIANVSLGAERVMVLRTKRQQQKQRPVDSDGDGYGAPPSQHEGDPGGNSDGPRRQTQRARLPHNSLCRMGLRTNMRWLHGIRQDRRAGREKTADELAYGGERISLTFRRIATFLNRQDEHNDSGDDGDDDGDEGSRREGPVMIWGQGATGKTRAEARPVVNGQTAAAVAMLRAFGRENQVSEFDWDAVYGAGFDVLHISAAPRLFLSPDALVNLRVQLLLADLGVSYARGSMAGAGAGVMSGRPQRQDGDVGEGTGTAVVVSAAPLGYDSDYDPPIKFVDTDEARTTVWGGIAIMLYIDRVYGRKKDETTKTENLPQEQQQHPYTHFQEAADLLNKYRAASGSCPDPDVVKSFQTELRTWAARARASEYVEGPDISLVDFAFWPVLHAMVASTGSGSEAKLPWIAELLPQDDDEPDVAALVAYYDRIKVRDSVRRVLAHA